MLVRQGRIVGCGYESVGIKVDTIAVQVYEGENKRDKKVWHHHGLLIQLIKQVALFLLSLTTNVLFHLFQDHCEVMKVHCYYQKCVVKKRCK